jgi:isopropylmalate/homocitrate/citramalate synthase
MTTPWKTEDWFVSPWNYEPEITNKYQFPKKILIHDVTLRDGEQQAGVIFRKDEKIKIAEHLASLGVHRIEAGMPAVSKDDEYAIREIVKRNLGPEIFVLCRCVVDDVKLAADCGVQGVVIEIPSSRHLIQYGYKWPLEKALDASIKATRTAKDLGLYTTFFTVDATREDLDWVIGLIEKVADQGHMDSLALVDTMGVITPQAVEYWVNKVKSRINKPLEAHFHNDFGLGVSNTISALLSGASVAHTTICGLGERSGNTSLEELAMALKLLYGIDLGLRYENFYDLAKLVIELSGHNLPQNKPIVGKDLFVIESGIISNWYYECKQSMLTEVFPFRPELVGQKMPKVVMGKGAGKATIKIWLEKMEIKVSDEVAENLLRLVKEKAIEKKGLLTEDEFRDIVFKENSSSKIADP